MLIIQSVQPGQSITPELSPRHERRSVTEGDGMSEGEKESAAASDQTENKAESLVCVMLIVGNEAVHVEYVMITVNSSQTPLNCVR